MICSFVLSNLRTGYGMEIRVCVSSCFETIGDKGDDITVFGMVHGREPQCSSGHEDIE